MISPTSTQFSDLISRGDEIWRIFTEIMDFCKIYVVFVILTSGLLGNCLSIVIFYRKRHLDSASASFLLPLAIFDSINIACSFYYWLSNGGILIVTYATSSFDCFMYNFVLYLAMYLSGWTLVCFSAERALVVNYPLKMSTILTPKTRRNLILSLLLGVPMFLISLAFEEVRLFPNTDNTMTACSYKPNTPEFVFIITPIIWFGVSCIIPCVLVAVFNICILIGIAKQNTERQKIITTNKNADAEKRCLRNLLLVSAFYMLFMLPYGVFWGIAMFYSPVLKHGPELNPKLRSMAVYGTTWGLTNYCINYLLYSYSLPFYRKELVSILSCGLLTRKSTSQITQSTSGT